MWRKRVDLGYVGEKVTLTDKDVRRVVVKIARDIKNGSDSKGLEMALIRVPVGWKNEKLSF